MLCQNCKTNIPDKVKFCPKCGVKVEMAKAQDVIFCSKCGAPHPLTAKFCKKDGTPLQKVTPPVTAVKKPDVIEKEIKPEAIVEPKLEAPAEVKTGEKLSEAVIEPKVPVEEKPPEKIPELEKPKDIIVCPRCGTSNQLTAKFCKKDGTPLKPEVAVQPEIEVAPKVEVKKEAKRPSKTWVWITACGLVLIIVGVGSYLYFSGQIGKKLAKVTAILEVPKPPEPTKAPEEIEKPITPQEPAIDIVRVERDLNRMLRNRGLGDVYAKVNEDLIVTLKGTVNDPRDKMLASNIAGSLKGIKSVENMIRVVRLPAPAPPPEAPAFPAPPSAPAEVPLPAPPPAAKINPAKLEGDINRALRNAGLRGVTSEVNDNLEVTLKGSVTSQHEKDRAFEIAKGFKEAKRIRDVIFVIEQ